MSETQRTDARGRWRRRLVELAVLIAVVVAIRAYQRRGVADGDAPALVGVAIDGTPASLAGASTPTLVHFWASWCGVCKAMDDNVAAIAEDARVITVATRSGGPRNILAAMEDEGLVSDGRPSFVVVPDPDGALASAWGVGAFPTSFVVDAAGTIRSVEVGYTTELGLRARLALAD